MPLIIIGLIASVSVLFLSNVIAVKEAFWYTFFGTSLFSSFYLFFEGVALVKKEQDNTPKTDKIPQCNIKVFEVSSNGLILILLGFILQITLIVTFNAKKFDFSAEKSIKDKNETTDKSDRNNSLSSQEFGSMSNQIIMNSYNVSDKLHSHSPPKPPTSRPPTTVKPCEPKENNK